MRMQWIPGRFSPPTRPGYEANVCGAQRIHIFTGAKLRCTLRSWLYLLLVLKCFLLGVHIKKIFYKMSMTTYATRSVLLTKKTMEKIIVWPFFVFD